jgi:hypothetical protein
MNAIYMSSDILAILGSLAQAKARPYPKVKAVLQYLSVKLLALFQEGGKLPLYREGKPKASFGDQPFGLVETGCREARACL